MLSRFALIATVSALSLSACASSEPPLLIDDTSSATIGVEGAPPTEIAAGLAPVGDDDQAIAR